MQHWLRMDIVEIVDISYIDTAELDRYIHESLKRWKIASVDIISKRVWRDEFSIKAAYHCVGNYPSHYQWPTLMVYVDYDEVDMTGRIEIEFIRAMTKSDGLKLIENFKDVFGSFNPATVPLPFRVKCPHCKAPSFL